MEQAEEEHLGRHGGIDQLVLAQGLEQRLGPLPDVQGRAAGVVLGDVLQQHAAGPPDEALPGLQLADRQAHASGGLFGLVEIALGGQGQGLALDGGHALVALGVRPLVDGHDEHAVAQEGARTGAGETARDLGHAGLVVTAVAPQGALGVVVADDVGHRSVALGLDDQAPGDLQAGADQGGERAGLAQQVGDGFRIGVAGQDLVDGGAEANHAAAHRPALDLEGGDEIVFGRVVHGRAK